MAIITNPTKVITGINTRWSYANVWDPKAIDGGKPKYSVSLIIPKDDTATIDKIKAAIQAAYEEGQSKLKGNGKSVPPLTAIKTPLRDGDLERKYMVNNPSFGQNNASPKAGTMALQSNMIPLSAFLKLKAAGSLSEKIKMLEQAEKEMQQIQQHMERLIQQPHIRQQKLKMIGY